jgi:hypothetical protein
VARPRTSLTERFWSKVDRKDQGDCWPWLGWRDGDGYGQISIGGAKGRRIRATAAAWLLTYGEMPTNQVLHRCDNPPCVRPDHLFSGTAKDNAADRGRKGRTARGKRRPETVVRGERQRRAKLTDEAVREIRARFDKGETRQELAREFGVSWTVVDGVVKRTLWSHVA